MTLIAKSSIFTPFVRIFKFQGSDLVGINGSNTTGRLDLCKIAIPYDQMSKETVTLKANSEMVLKFPNLGIKLSFLAIVPNYLNKDINKNFLQYKFTSVSAFTETPFYEFTQILVFTGTKNSPIPQVILKNTGNCDVNLDILVGANDVDIVNDVEAFLYLNNLMYDNIHTFNEIASGILTFLDSDGVIVGSVDISEISNISFIQNKNRIIIDESSEKNIILDFVSLAEALQAMSALNYVMNDPNNRALPIAKDTTPPVITLVPLQPNQTTYNINVYTYNNNFTKQDLLNLVVQSVIDDRDGIITLSSDNVTFSNGLTINNAGIYTATITAKDLAGNVSTQTVTINAVAIIDEVAPVINFTSNVINHTVNMYDLFVDNDSKLYKQEALFYCVASVTDNIDGTIPLSNVVVTFRNVLNQIIPEPITSQGNYVVEFAVKDMRNNETVELVNFNVIDTSIFRTTVTTQDAVLLPIVHNLNASNVSIFIYVANTTDLVDAFTYINDNNSISLITTPGGTFDVVIVKDKNIFVSDVITIDGNGTLITHNLNSNLLEVTIYDAVSMAEVDLGFVIVDFNNIQIVANPGGLFKVKVKKLI